MNHYGFWSLGWLIFGYLLIYQCQRVNDPCTKILSIDILHLKKYLRAEYRVLYGSLKPTVSGSTNPANASRHSITSHT